MIRIAFVGYHFEGRECLARLLELSGNKWEVAFCLTLDPNTAKGYGDCVFNMAHEVIDHNKPLYYASGINTIRFARLIKEYNVDLIVCIGWSEILSESILGICRYGVIGAHASLLPAFPGGSPINWAIIKGAKQTGNTLMRLGAKLDAGDIIDQESFDITDADNCYTLYKKVGSSNARMVTRFVERLSDGVYPDLLFRNQLPHQEKMLRRRSPKDGLISAKMSREEVSRLVRATCWPYPGAYIEFKSYRIIIDKVDYLQDKPASIEKIRSILYCDTNINAYFLKCSDGWLRVLSSRHACSE